MTSHTFGFFVFTKNDIAQLWLAICLLSFHFESDRPAMCCPFGNNCKGELENLDNLPCMVHSLYAMVRLN